MGNTVFSTQKYIDIGSESKDCYTKSLPNPKNIEKYFKSNVEIYSERTGYFRAIPPSWKKITKKVLKSFLDNSTIKKKDGYTYIKKGTRLYHASKHCPFFYDNKGLQDMEKITFFGADPFISIWYSAEIKGKYLYVFKLVKDLKIDIEILSKKNPKNTKVCQDEVCIHPQYILRCDYEGIPDGYFQFNNSGITEIGLEITLPYKKYKNYFQIEKIFELDYQLIEENCKKTLEEWDPRQAIINEVKIKPPP